MESKIDFSDYSTQEIIDRTKAIFNNMGVYTICHDSSYGICTIMGIVPQATSEKFNAIREVIAQIIKEVDSNEVQDNNYIAAECLYINHDESSHNIYITFQFVN